MTFDVGALGASTASACCLAGTTRSRRPRVSAALMVLAMVGSVFSESSSEAGLLAFVLALASAAFALTRVDGRVPPMSLHRALGGITMAALVAMSLGMSSKQPMALDHVHGMPLPALVLAFVAAFLGYTVWLIATMLRSRNRVSDRGRRKRVMLEVGEVAGMAIGVVLMAAM